MLNQNSSEDRSYLRRGFTRVVISIALLLAFVASAAAYTLVFRDGRRIEIADDFTVTRTTLTYEVSPGFNRTVLIALLDVPATERANKETAGAFFKHKNNDNAQTASVPAAPTPIQASEPARLTVTNQDLKSFQARRIESEKRYEQRRRELGLPSVAETLRQREIDEAALLDRMREKSASDAQEQSYWRGRARELRTQIAAVDSQVNYVRSRLAEVSESSAASAPVITEVYPIWPNNRPWGSGRRGPWRNQPNGTYGSPRPVPGWPSQRPNGYPNTTYGYPGIYSYPGPYSYPGTYGYPNIYGYPNNGYPNVYGYPPAADNNLNSVDAVQLRSRLDDLLVKRAGLMVQWQQLEDEARDARVPQVWLEP